jgi:hypothetical protein
MKERLGWGWLFEAAGEGPTGRAGLQSWLRRGAAQGMQTETGREALTNGFFLILGYTRPPADEGFSWLGAEGQQGGGSRENRNSRIAAAPPPAGAIRDWQCKIGGCACVGGLQQNWKCKNEKGGRVARNEREGFCGLLMRCWACWVRAICARTCGEWAGDCTKHGCGLPSCCPQRGRAALAGMATARGSACLTPAAPGAGRPAAAAADSCVATTGAARRATAAGSRASRPPAEASPRR